MDDEIIIGREIHVQLQTESKMLREAAPTSACSAEISGTVFVGSPGTLPVMNRKAFDLALKTAVALHAEIAPFTKWDRKKNDHPDLPEE